MERHGPPRFPIQSISINEDIIKGMYPLFYYRPPSLDNNNNNINNFRKQKSISRKIDVRPATNKTKKPSSQTRQSKGKQSETARRTKESNSSNSNKRQMYNTKPHVYSHPLYPSLSIAHTQEPPQFLGTCIAISPKVVITAGHHYVAKNDDVGYFIVGIPQEAQEAKYLSRCESKRRKMNEMIAEGKIKGPVTESKHLLRINLSLRSDGNDVNDESMMYGIRAKYAQKKPDLDLCVFWLEEPLPFFTTRMRLFSPLATVNPVTVSSSHAAVGIKKEEDEDTKQCSTPFMSVARETSSQYYIDGESSYPTADAYDNKTVISSALVYNQKQHIHPLLAVGMPTDICYGSPKTAPASQPTVHVATVYYKANQSSHRDIVVSCGVVIECLRRIGSIRPTSPTSPNSSSDNYPTDDDCGATTVPSHATEQRVGDGIAVACVVRGTISEKGCSGAPVVDVTGNYIVGLHVASNKTKMQYSHNIYGLVGCSASDKVTSEKCPNMFNSTMLSTSTSESTTSTTVLHNGFPNTIRSSSTRMISPVLSCPDTYSSPSSSLPSVHHHQRSQSSVYPVAVSRTSEFITSAAIIAALLILEVYLYPRNDYVGFDEEDE